MRLTKEKLLAAWRIRKQILSSPTNERIIRRHIEISSLFNEIIKSSITFNEETQTYTYNDNDVIFKDGSKPSVECYFSCKEDGVTADYAFGGIYNMCEVFPDNFSGIIKEIGCMLGGFESNGEHHMIDEYRIISNSVTGRSDNGTLNSSGQVRHPSSHFADNNYFFTVVDTIKKISDGSFKCEDTKLVLRWPNSSYYANDIDAEASQKDALRYRFPYKYFYMWTHEVLHPVSLMAYRNLVQQEDREIKYPLDEHMSQDFYEFTGENGWPRYSSAIKNMIPENERGDDFWNEMSMLLSVLMIQDQQMKNIKELLETGNHAIILYGPPGTGKTYSAKDLVCQELDINQDDAGKRKEELNKHLFSGSSTIEGSGAWTLVQFHPNYTYEDFIGGICPNLNGTSLSYTLKTGVFKKFCDCAAKSENKDKKFIIIIDEINRADLSSVFGELMYALEYRGEEVSIPNFAEKFVIPSNVYLIGTMNSIDKSLVTFDLALRRRFGFIKIMPQLSVLETILEKNNLREDYKTAFIKRCEDLNARIANPQSRLQLGVDYQIGHAYYGKLSDFLENIDATKEPQVITTFELEKLWEYHLQPLLEEYLGNRIDDSEVKNCLDSIKEDFTKPLVYES